MQIVTKMSKLVRPMLRNRVFAAFAKIASAVDARTAHLRTKEFFRRGRGDWTRSLN